MSVALQRPGSGVVSMIPGITEGCVGAWGVVRSLVPKGRVAAGAVLIWVAYAAMGP